MPWRWRPFHGPRPRTVQRCPRDFQVQPFLQLCLSTVIMGVAFVVAEKFPHKGYWSAGRWFFGGVTLLALAEMISAAVALVGGTMGVVNPTVMRSPWRARSVGEFWATRWNTLVAEHCYRRWCFAPFARSNAIAGLFATFICSGFCHALLAYVWLGSWPLSLEFGLFFVVQPFFILLERWLGERRWQPALRWVWTLGILAITCPLLVEPFLQFTELWPFSNLWFAAPTIVFAFVILLAGVISLVSIVACPRAAPAPN